MKLIRLPLVSFVLALSLSVAHADEVSKTSKKKKIVGAPKTETIAPKTTASTGSTSDAYAGEGELNVTGSLGAVDGNFVWGPGLQVEWPVVIDGDSFAFGFQTGFYCASTSEEILNVRTTSKIWGIPLMVTGKYLIPTETNFLKPYLALGMGLGIDHNGAVKRSGVTVQSGETNVHFTLLARPGVTFGEEQRWFAELPFGVLFTEFAILPTIGYHF
jgi:hypothetical protein